MGHDRIVPVTLPKGTVGKQLEMLQEFARSMGLLLILVADGTNEEISQYSSKLCKSRFRYALVDPLTAGHIDPKERFIFRVTGVSTAASYMYSYLKATYGIYTPITKTPSWLNRNLFTTWMIDHKVDAYVSIISPRRDTWFYPKPHLHPTPDCGTTLAFRLHLRAPGYAGKTSAINIFGYIDYQIFKEICALRNIAGAFASIVLPSISRELDIINTAKNYLIWWGIVNLSQSEVYDSQYTCSDQDKKWQCLHMCEKQTVFKTWLRSMPKGLAEFPMFEYEN